MSSACIAGGVRPEQELRRLPQRLPSRTRAMAVVPRVLIDNKASATHTLIEVNGRDRPGFLYLRDQRADRAEPADLDREDLDLRRQRVVDVFYVKDQFGLKIDKEARLQQIREALMATLAEGERVQTAAAP